MAKAVEHFVDNADRNRVIVPGMPSVPFAICLIGPPGSGKSTVIRDLVLNRYNHVFKGKDIYLWHANYDRDDKYKDVVKRRRVLNNHILTEYREDDMNELIEYLQERYDSYLADHPRKPYRHSLIILDDMGYGNQLRGKTKGNALEKLFNNRRHLNASIIVGCQYLKQINPNMRSACTCMIVFGLDNEELEQFCKAYCYTDHAEFKRHFIRVMQEPHNFIVMVRDPHQSGSVPYFLDRYFQPLDALNTPLLR